MHYTMWKKGKVKAYDESSSSESESESSDVEYVTKQIQSLNINDESVIKKAFEIYSDHKKYVYNVRNDPAYYDVTNRLYDVKQYAKKLIHNSPRQLKNIIQKYTEGTYYGEPFHVALNNYIQNPEPFNATLNKAYEALHELSHEVRLPAMVLWKGFKPFDGMNNEFVKGNIVIHERLYSTSYDEYKVLESYFTHANCCVFQIYVPNGAHGLPLESVSGFDESEILLPARLKTVIVDKFVKNINNRNITYYVGIFMY